MRKPVVIVAGYWVRYPLGGHVLGQLHYLLGLQQLGCEVVFIEHFGWASSCYNPQDNTMSDDPTYGLAVLKREFASGSAFRNGVTSMRREPITVYLAMLCGNSAVMQTFCLAWRPRLGWTSFVNAARARTWTPIPGSRNSAWCQRPVHRAPVTLLPATSNFTSPSVHASANRTARSRPTDYSGGRRGGRWSWNWRRSVARPTRSILRR